MTIDDRFTPNMPSDNAASQRPRVQTITAAGAITIADGKVFINNAAGAIAVTIAAPPADMDGATLEIVNLNARAHTVTFATTGFNSAGTSSDVATFAAVAGTSFRIIARSGVWYTYNWRNNDLNVVFA